MENISFVYRDLLPDFFTSPFPDEVLTTCDNCPMCRDDAIESASARSSFSNRFCTFHQDIKCCTFHPNLPNFLVGAILSSTSRDLLPGSTRIKERIESGDGVTPLSIRPPTDYFRSYSELTDYTFGQNRDLICPYYNLVKKNCFIWPYWQATCSTYFCKSVEGIAGKRFWNFMNVYLCNVEKILAFHAAQQLGMSCRGKMILSPNGIEAKYRTEDLDWGIWKERRVDFFLKSYAVIHDLSRHDFETICCAELSQDLRKVKQAYTEAICATPFEKLKINPRLHYKVLLDGRYQYDTADGSCVLSSRLHNSLPYFDGNMDNKAVVERILRKENIRYSQNLIQKLYKNRVLISSD